VGGLTGVGLGHDIGCLVSFERLVDVLQDLGVDHVLGFTHWCGVGTGDGLGVVRQRSPQRHHLRVVEGAQEVRVAVVLVAHFVGDDSVAGCILEQVVAHVDGIEEELPVVVETSVVGGVLTVG